MADPSTDGVLHSGNSTQVRATRYRPTKDPAYKNRSNANNNRNPRMKPILASCS